MDGYPLDQRRQVYFAVWADVLGALLGWPEERVIRWADSAWGYWMRELEDVFYEQPPIYWALPALISEPLKNRLSQAEIDDLLRRLLSAFDDEHDLQFAPGTDWRPYRRKVQRILRRYGEKLP